MNELFTDILKLDSDSIYKLSKLIDKKNKISKEEFEAQAQELVATNFTIFNSFMNAKSISEIPEVLQGSTNVNELSTVLSSLEKMNVTNCVFDPTIMRGFDYYTGIVFEINDTNPENKRAMFGGGRYDNLLDMFGIDPVPAVGFGMGDVTIQDFLETYNLLPELSSEIDLVLCTLDEQFFTKENLLIFQIKKLGRKSPMHKKVELSLSFVLGKRR